MSKQNIVLSEKETKILQALDALDYKWLARDGNDLLYAYLDKPIKYKWYWYAGNTPADANRYYKLDSSLFMFITFKRLTNIRELLEGDVEK